MSYEKQAFFQVCDEAKPARSSYVSLYASLPFYGGPEEGGWWGHDYELVAYEEFSTEEAAEAAAKSVRLLAADLSREARDRFNQHCADECAWLEERGLDSDYLPEVDGEVSYEVHVETRAGEHEYRGVRHYE